MKESPGTEIYGSDDYHASPQGSYLAALVFFKTLYSESPLGAVRDFGTFAIDEATAGTLQKLAESAE